MHTAAFLILCSAVLLSCKRTTSHAELGTVSLDSLKQLYAPDSRVAVYDLAVQQRGEKVVLKGEVDNLKAKEASLTAIRESTGADVLDSVRVLPDAQIGEKQYGIVSVSVGNLRTRPGHANELCTQALMGTVVRLLKKTEGWYFVQLPDRYLGWIEASAVKTTSAEGVDAWKSSRKVIVTTFFTFVREHQAEMAQTVSDAVMGGLMQFLSHRGTWTEVGLPDGRHGYIESTAVSDFDTWKKTRKLTPGNIEKTAKMFVGIPYLWGGTSIKGMDCSGFTKTVFRLNGLELNRDADQQARMGEAIDPGKDFKELKKGDLLFFGRRASADKQENITHVGIYLEKGEFIHSPGGAGVKLNSFYPSAANYSEYERNRFVRARRVIGINQIPEIAKE